LTLALVVAVAAVVLGLGLGLAPGASRRALGPLRTLALAAVIGVALLHLLPEAFTALGILGVAVFAAGMLLPRWIAVARRASGHDEHAVGLELGFWGLLAHHVGDGMALGAYSRMDEHEGHSHADVLLALVLHTVPLVAVVSAGYARAYGTKKAVTRAAALAGASVLGIFAARLVPPELVESARAWIAAAVAGLLLHGLSHDMTLDLPRDGGGRVFDLLAALCGAAVVWIGASLDGHHAHGAFELLASMGRLALASAFPLVVGLLLALILVQLPARLRESRFARAAALSSGGLLVPEAFLLTLVNFGWACALVGFAGSALAAWVVPAPAESAVSPAESLPAARFAERLDHVTAWAFIALAAAALLGLALPERSFGMAGYGFAAVVLALVVVLCLPRHVLVGPIAGGVLASRGMPITAVLCLFTAGRSAASLRQGLVLGGAVVLALGLGAAVPVLPLAVPAEWSESALVLLAGLVLARVYHLGFRGWLAPLAPEGECKEEPDRPAHEHEHSHAHAEHSHAHAEHDHAPSGPAYSAEGEGDRQSGEHVLSRGE